MFGALANAFSPSRFSVKAPDTGGKLGFVAESRVPQFDKNAITRMRRLPGAVSQGQVTKMIHDAEKEKRKAVLLKEYEAAWAIYTKAKADQYKTRVNAATHMHKLAAELATIDAGYARLVNDTNFGREKQAAALSGYQEACEGARAFSPF